MSCLLRKVNYEASPSTCDLSVQSTTTIQLNEDDDAYRLATCTQRLRLVTSLSTILMLFSLSDAWHLNMYNDTKPRISKYSTSVCYSQEKWKVICVYQWRRTTRDPSRPRWCLRRANPLTRMNSIDRGTFGMSIDILSLNCCSVESL